MLLTYQFRNNHKNISIIELNCETDFVAKYDDFINFAEEVCFIAFNQKDAIKISEMIMAYQTR